MTTLTAPITELPKGFRPLLRHEYDTLVDAGVFVDQRIELLGGVLIEMSPQRPAHSGLVVELTKLLVVAAGDRYVVAVQAPFALDDLSEPEPDVAVLPPGSYRERHPDRALLLIEVALASKDIDLGEKARRYAAAGVPEYWVVDVATRTVHVHRDPSPTGTWQRVWTQDKGTLQAKAAPEITLDLDVLL